MTQSILKYFFGLPASGKSTISNQILRDNIEAVRLNKDELRKLFENKTSNLIDFFNKDILKRMMFMSSKFTKERSDQLDTITKDLISKFKQDEQQLFKAINAKSFGPREKWIIKLESCILNSLVNNDTKMIILDNTGYNTSHLSRARSICKNYTIEFIDMHKDYGVTLEQCIERNRNRKEKVPDVAIYAMNKKYQVISRAKERSSFQPFASDKKYIILDLDGTIADCKHRLKYINGIDGIDGKKNWKDFFRYMGNDTIIESTKQLVDLTYKDYDVVVVTGRPAEYKEVSEKWLKDNNVRYNAIYMRPKGDYRPDYVVKQEIIDLYLEVNKIEMWIDDKEEVINQVRKNGLKTLYIKGN